MAGVSQYRCGRSHRMHFCRGEFTQYSPALGEQCLILAVTSLTAEADSFFSRRLGVKGQSSPQDVACGMFVCLSGVTASLADECRLGDAILACSVSTGLAAIRGVPGINLDQCASSVFRFGAQY